MAITCEVVLLFCILLYILCYFVLHSFYCIHSLYIQLMLVLPFHIKSLRSKSFKPDIPKVVCSTKHLAIKMILLHEKRLHNACREGRNLLFSCSTYVLPEPNVWSFLYEIVLKHTVMVMTERYVNLFHLSCRNK